MARPVAIDLFEGSRRILRHTFFGRTPAETRNFIRAHRQADPFFDAGLRRRPFKGIRVTARRVR